MRMRTVVDAGDAHVETVLAVFLALRLTRVKGYLWLELHRGEGGPSIGDKTERPACRLPA